MTIYSVLGIAAGTALLFFGRRLYWMLVLGLGVALGLSTPQHYGVTLSEVLPWVTALSGGLAALLLARLMPKATVWAAGFAAGAYGAGLLLLVLNFNPAPSIWMYQFGGACLGLVCFGLCFEWGLTLFSVILGAGLIANVLDLGVPGRPLAFLTLVAVGMAVQCRLKRSGSPHSLDIYR
ncbi:MAG: hypothetical protein WBG37_01430 [Desulfobacterales bacterium]